MHLIATEEAAEQIEWERSRMLRRKLRFGGTQIPATAECRQCRLKSWRANEQR